MFLLAALLCNYRRGKCLIDIGTEGNVAELADERVYTGEMATTVTGQTAAGQQAFVLRMTHEPGLVAEGLASDEIIVGWSAVEELLDETDWVKFRQFIKQRYYPDEQDFRKAAANGGSLWRFLREMREGDFVVVPIERAFYIAEITCKPRFDRSKVVSDTAYRRPVRWLNDKQQIPRADARAALQSRMGAYQACVSASDLLV
jgi:hypothetical protein